MSLLRDQSRSVLPLRSAKAQEFGELRREKCTYTHAPWAFPFKLARTSSFRSARTDIWKATLERELATETLKYLTLSKSLVLLAGYGKVNYIEIITIVYDDVMCF